MGLLCVFHITIIMNVECRLKASLNRYILAVFVVNLLLLTSHEIL